MNKIIKLIRHLLHEFVVHIVPQRMKQNAISCEEVTRLLEQENITFKKKLQLNMHLLICQNCVHYKDQISIISNQSKNLSKLELTQEQKERINKSKSDIISQIKNSK